MVYQHVELRVASVMQGVADIYQPLADSGQLHHQDQHGQHLEARCTTIERSRTLDLVLVERHIQDGVRQGILASADAIGIMLTIASDGTKSIEDGKQLVGILLPSLGCCSRPGTCGAGLNVHDPLSTYHCGLWTDWTGYLEVDHLKRE